MKRFLLFAFSTYYPGGGWEDLAGSFDTQDECLQAFNINDWWYGNTLAKYQVVDLHSGLIVLSGKGTPDA